MNYTRAMSQLFESVGQDPSAFLVNFQKPESRMEADLQGFPPEASSRYHG